MFIISAPDKRTSLGKQIYFLNDTKDVIDLAISMNATDTEIGKMNKWLMAAHFGSRIEMNVFVIMCMTDDQARNMAAFYGCLPEYEKHYGKCAS